MKYVAYYDAALKRLAQSGNRVSKLGLINVIVWPFVFLIIVVWAIFDASGRQSLYGFIVSIIISLGLLVALFYSGFKFLNYSNEIESEAAVKKIPID